MAGIWRQHETSDGTYSFDALLDAHELLDVKEANQFAYQEYRSSQTTER